MALTALVRDPDPADSFGTVQVFGKGGKVLGSFDCLGKSPCKTTFTVEATLLRGVRAPDRRGSAGGRADLAGALTT